MGAGLPGGACRAVTAHVMLLGPVAVSDQAPEPLRKSLDDADERHVITRNDYASLGPADSAAGTLSIYADFVAGCLHRLHRTVSERQEKGLGLFQG